MSFDSDSMKIRFSLSATHGAKKKQVAAAFRDEEETDETEAAKKRRVESLLQPMIEEAAAPAADGGETAEDGATDKSNVALHDSINQQNGWRVKLYRLNVDGSWDDCGTGRILCTFTAKHNSEQVHRTGSEDAASEHSTVSNLGAWKAFQRIPHNANLTLQQQRRLAAALDEAVQRELGNPTLFMHAELQNNMQYYSQHGDATSNIHHMPRILLRARVLLWETYQRQGESIITWCEPAQETCDPNQQDTAILNSSTRLNHHGSQEETCSYNGVDLALSFQDNTGCIDIWKHISTVQQMANDILKSKNGFLCESSDGRKVPYLNTWPHPQHLIEAPLGHTTTIRGTNHLDGATIHLNNTQTIQPQSQFIQGDETTTTITTTTRSATNPLANELYQATVPMAVAAAAAAYGNIPHVADSCITDQKLIFHSGYSNNYTMPLPSPPSFHNLEDIADILVSAQTMTQRELLAAFIAKADCAYLHALCSLFPAAEARDDFQALATLASIVKATVLLNDPDIVEVIVSNGQLFEKCCCCLEYDPDLRDKANHRWFIRHRLKFRTVILMEDPELISNIHIAFRVTYLRDTLLRPTMDESCLSTLASLLTFYHTHVLKGIICAPSNPTMDETTKSFHNTHCDNGNDTRFSPRSYLVSILRLLGTEIKMIRKIEWDMDDDDDFIISNESEIRSVGEDSRRQVNKNEPPFIPWDQHLAPQDESLESRKIRRRGCLSFLRELFVMVRTSLQQADKDDFYAMIVLLDVYLEDATTPQSVNLLSLMGALLSDPNADISERGMCLEILSTIAMQHASLIRQHCLEVYTSSQEGKLAENGTSHVIYVPKPQPNDRRQVLFYSHHNDLLMSLLFVMAVECDAGVMLQTSELMRIIMDTEMINDHSLLGTGVLDNEEDELLCGNGSFHGPHSSSGVHGGSEHNSFLKMFYDHYVPWLVAPFQYSVFITKRALPFDFVLYNKDGSVTTNHKLEIIMSQPSTEFKSINFLEPIPCCSIRASFSIELLSFCVRAHCFRMKFYVIRARVLSHVLKFLRPETKVSLSGERCVKLAALRFLRSILAVKDEFYNRHIVQHNLFDPVFETFRTNPIGDNLVASSIVEMCDFITRENIKSLIEYIVTKHLHEPKVKPADKSQSLEDVAMPYVDTLTRLRKQYEESSSLHDTSSLFTSVDEKVGKGAKLSNEKAIEDQRKFVEHDEEESYFNDDES